MEEKKEIKNTFGKDIDLFVNQVQSLHTTLPFVSSMLKDSGNKAEKLLKEFFETKCLKEEREGKHFYIIPVDHRFKHRTLKKNTSHIRIAYSIVRKNFVVSLVSQFDAYLGALIRLMFISRPELLNSSEKNLTFSKLLEFADLDEAREFIIEKEVEAVLRDSHASHFKWLENKVGIPLTKDLPSWADFIEVTERRNLFVHCNGVVSAQYLAVCNQYNYKFEKEIKVGMTLGVTEEYFNKAYRTILEIGYKLGQVLWRKLLPDEAEAADMNLLDSSFELIQEQDYDTAIVLLEFATGVIKKHSSEDIKLRLLLNLAQCHKWKGNNDKCLKIVNNTDWTAYSNTFKLASSVLLDDFVKAASIMKVIGANDNDMNKGSYKDWPIFKEFRKTEDFLTTFKEVFAEEFKLTEEA
jgi:hypothetical protein